jgi:hypothetical protein
MTSVSRPPDLPAPLGTDDAWFRSVMTSEPPPLLDGRREYGLLAQEQNRLERRAILGAVAIGGAGALLLIAALVAAVWGMP